MNTVSQISNNIRRIIARNILAQESGYQWELIRQLYNAIGFEDEADVSRFNMERSVATGRIDVYDSAYGIVWEMKRSSLDILNTKGIHNKGHEAITPTEQATNYMKSIHAEYAITTNGFQFYKWNAKSECIGSIDMTDNTLTDAVIASFFTKCFGGSVIDLFVEQYTNKLDTFLDNFMDKAERKTTASYWSNIRKARALFHKYLDHYGLYEEYHKSRDNASALRALLDRISKIKVLDPSVGGCALLVAAQTELCILEKLIETSLKELGEDVDPYINIRPENFYGIEKYDAQFAEAKSVAIRALTKFDSFGGFRKPCKPYNIIQADALEISWREFVGDGEVLIFANPPFTTGKHLNADQKAQCKTFGVANLDAAFMVKAARESLYGVWIVNSAITITCGSALDKVCHTIPGKIHYGGDSNKNGNGGIISNGDKTERWMITEPGRGGNLGDIYSKIMLTDWCNVTRGWSFDPVERLSTGKYEVETYDKRFFTNSDSTLIRVTDKDYILSQKTQKGYTYKPRKISAPHTYGCRVLLNPTIWTLQVIQSRVFNVWAMNIEPTTVFCGGGYLQCTPQLSRSIHTFPLFQGDDLSVFDSMTDDEIFQELLSRYNKLTNK